MATSTTTATKAATDPPPSSPPQLPLDSEKRCSQEPRALGNTGLDSMKPASSLREWSRRLRPSKQKPEEAADEPSSPSTEAAHNDKEHATVDTTSPPTPTLSSNPTPQQSWNHPRSNIPRLGFAFFSFIIAGLNDAAIGALLPSLEAYYSLTYTTVSLIFLTPFAGYALAAFLNSTIHARYGQRGIAVLAPLCHVVTYVVVAVHPPFPVIVVINIISGFGNGLTDACFCAWIGVMKSANAVQGCMHACYSLGALCAPLIVTGMVVTGGLEWWYYYYFMVGVSVLEWAGLTASFWGRTGEVYRREHRVEGEEGGDGQEEGKKSGGTREALRSRVTWTCAAFFFFYLGIEVGLGGWVITFMLRVRNATPYDAGVSGTGFWAGMTVGRAGLGFITERYGERLCVSIYLCFALALQLVFWLVPHFVVSAVAVALLGVFLGPMFPGCVMMASRLLPSRMHVSALGFAMAIGGTGGTVFPFAIGAIAAKAGVRVLQPIIVALIVVVAALWLSFPRVKKRE